MEKDASSDRRRIVFHLFLAMSVSGIDLGCDASLGSAGPVVPADEAWVVGWLVPPTWAALQLSNQLIFLLSLPSQTHTHAYCAHTNKHTHTHTSARIHRYSKTQKNQLLCDAHSQTYIIHIFIYPIKWIPIVTPWFQTLAVMWILDRACFRRMWIPDNSFSHFYTWVSSLACTMTVFWIDGMMWRTARAEENVKYNATVRQVISLSQPNSNMDFL